MGDTDYIGQIIADDDDVLHFGVKGMKWGQRKQEKAQGQADRLSKYMDRKKGNQTAANKRKLNRLQGEADRRQRQVDKKLAKGDKKYENQFKGMAGFVKINNAVADRINPKLDVLNAKSEYKGVNLYQNPALNKKYLKEYENLLKETVNEVNDAFGTNPSGTKRVTLSTEGSGENINWVATYEDLTHADFDTGFVIVPELDANGHILGQNIQPMNYLEHSGVKGMKWGVRKDRPSSGPKPIVAPPKGSKNETSAERYVRLTNHAKKHGANTLDDDDLSFVTRRGNAINQINRLNERKPGWAAELAKEVLKTAVKQRLNNVSNEAGKKYIDAPLSDAINPKPDK